MPVRKDKEAVHNPLEKFRRIFTEISSPKGGLPTMPTKIADKASSELGDMIARYTAWREFTEDRHMEACAVYAQCKSEYDLAVDKEMLTSSASTVTERKASAKSNPRIEKLYKNLSEAEMYRDLLANKLDSFSNVLAMLSRELTRRGVDNM
jgi:predicted RNase H-like nuclease (RuvC/YqgF family)